ncbi:MAG: invasion associated locus B family protein [Parvularculaceae bacterium]
MKILISALAVAAALTGAAVAAPQDGETFGAWKVVCQGASPCQAFLGLKEEKTGRLVLSASAHKLPADKNPTLVLSLPLGLALKEGVALLSGAPGKAPVPAAVDVCFPDGCRATIELTPEALAALTAGDSFEVRFIAYGATDRVESVKVPANGLSDALKRLSRK